jgi:hypothetical protein
MVGVSPSGLVVGKSSQVNEFVKTIRFRILSFSNLKCEYYYLKLCLQTMPRLAFKFWRPLRLYSWQIWKIIPSIQINICNLCSHFLTGIVKAKIIIKRLLLYEIETWSVILGQEHRLRMLESEVLIDVIFVPKPEKVKWMWRKLQI